LIESWNVISYVIVAFEMSSKCLILCPEYNLFNRTQINQGTLQKEFSKFMVVWWLPKTWLNPKIRRKCLIKLVDHDFEFWDLIIYLPAKNSSLISSKIIDMLFGIWNLFWLRLFIWRVILAWFFRLGGLICDEYFKSMITFFKWS